MQGGKRELRPREGEKGGTHVVKEGVLAPMDGSLLVGLGVGEGLDLSRLAAEDSVKVRSDCTGERDQYEQQREKVS